MSYESTDGLERPLTYVVGIEQAMETLDYREMITLAELFEEWAFAESGLDEVDQTNFLKWSADYERIAEFCGKGWTASDDESPPGVIAFIARRALSHSAAGAPMRRP